MSIDKMSACDEAFEEYIVDFEPILSARVALYRTWCTAWERAIRHADDWACLRTDPDEYPLQQAHAAPTMDTVVQDVRALTELITKGVNR